MAQAQLTALQANRHLLQGLEMNRVAGSVVPLAPATREETLVGNEELQVESKRRPPASRRSQQKKERVALKKRVGMLTKQPRKARVPKATMRNCSRQKLNYSILPSPVQPNSDTLAPFATAVVAAAANTFPSLPSQNFLQVQTSPIPLKDLLFFEIFFDFCVAPSLDISNLTAMSNPLQSLFSSLNNTTANSECLPTSQTNDSTSVSASSTQSIASLPSSGLLSRTRISLFKYQLMEHFLTLITAHLQSAVTINCGSTSLTPPHLSTDQLFALFIESCQSLRLVFP